jgi:hypothetical protein
MVLNLDESQAPPFRTQQQEQQQQQQQQQQQLHKLPPPFVPSFQPFKDEQMGIGR